MSTMNEGLPKMTPELVTYYGNRRLMIRNVALIGLCNLSWNVAFTITGPLIVLRMLELGLRENIQATINSVNALMLSFLVMLFSWMSDHTVSRLGRRKPYLFASAPFIIVATVVFPFIDEPSLLMLIVVLYVVKMLAMDLKASTFPLLSIDCVPRHLLAQANSVFTIAGGIVGFVAMRAVGPLLAVAEWVPFVLSGGLMTITTLMAFWIQEPPISHPATEPFRPWSTFKVAACDKRIFVLMAGVGMVSGYFTMQNAWLWFWAKETLNLDRQTIFEALSWAGLLNIVLAYPTGWLIDRWGAIKVATLYFIGQIACFAMAMNISDKAGLITLSLVGTVVAPLYGAVDIMVFKNAAPKDVGSITSTNSCIRNAWNAALGMAAGWIIFWFNHNYRIGYVMGIVAATVGFTLLWVYHWLMRRPVAPMRNLLDGTDENTLLCKMNGCTEKEGST
jgi:MFS family permease